MPTIDYIIIARQAGTANAFTPLIRILQGQGKKLLLLSFSAAYEVWIKESFATHLISCFAEAEQLLHQHAQAKVLLTGSSLVANEDAEFWHWADCNQLLSIAFVDHWVNYSERFSVNSDVRKFDVLPDKIAVIDQVASQGMIAAGCPENRIVITGHPAFDSLHESYGQVNQSLRQRYIDSKSDFLWLFISEPLSRVYGEDINSNSLGYTELTVLSVFLPRLNALAQQCACQITILIKPHPVELQEQGLKDLLVQLDAFTALTIKIVEETQRYQLISACDVVIGMTSLLLFEASLIGRPVISLQFNRQHGCDLTDNRDAIEVVIGDHQLSNSVLPYLERNDISFQRRFHQTFSACERFTELLEKTKKK